MVGSKYSVRIGLKDIWLYFILIPFLYPRGFSEINASYKLFFTIWIWIAVMAIFAQFSLRFIKEGCKFNNKKFMISLYFLLAILITLAKRGTIASGLQQMIAAPALCIFFSMNFEDDGMKIINSIVNILLVNFIINLVAFRSIFSAYEHIVFLGHVQTISQLGLLALYFGCLQLLLDKNRRIKAVFLIIILFITMFTGDADSARIAAIIMIVVGVMYKCKIYHLCCFKSKWYVLGFFCLSLFIVYTVTGNNIFLNIIDNYTFSGRSFVWKNALELFYNSPYLGYGIDGVLITTFWSNGMNYAHNQIVQNLIDGGVVLCISFWMMMIEFASYIDRIQIKKYKVLANGTLIAFLAIMITDSTTLYCYMFLFLSSLFGLYRLVDGEKMKGN